MNFGPLEFAAWLRRKDERRRVSRAALARQGNLLPGPGGVVPSTRERRSTDDHNPRGPGFCDDED